MEPITCIATGDTFITRRFPQEGYQGLEELQAVIGHGSHELRDVELYHGGADSVQPGELYLPDGDSFPPAL